MYISKIKIRNGKPPGRGLIFPNGIIKLSIFLVGHAQLEVLF